MDANSRQAGSRDKVCQKRREAGIEGSRARRRAVGWRRPHPSSRSWASWRST